MKKTFYYLLLALVFILVGWFLNVAYNLPKSSNNPISSVIPKPLEKYTIENLAKINFKEGKIKVGEILKEDPKYTSYEFSFEFSPDLSNDLKKTSGLINIPQGNGPFPVVVLYRGYIDQKAYKTGDGTKRVGEYFASNGFITVAPDFLGYAQSDKEAGSIFESRFQTYVTALNILSSVKTLDNWDEKNIFIWGHSNGGQVALTVLEESGVNYPTVLWAPVSKPFPYSILYYTDESDDHGKLIRSELSKFEDSYDVERYSLTNYLNKIKAPISLYQGSYDDAVPVSWSDSLNKTLESNEIEVKYHKYPGVDHNMNPLWSSIVQSSLEFFNKNLIN
ncbi:MAG: alpha/beta hydrolase family protein [Microgenomates group bacterium]